MRRCSPRPTGAGVNDAFEEHEIIDFIDARRLCAVSQRNSLGTRGGPRLFLKTDARNLFGAGWDHDCGWVEHCFGTGQFDRGVLRCVRR